MRGHGDRARHRPRPVRLWRGAPHLRPAVPGDGTGADPGAAAGRLAARRGRLAGDLRLSGGLRRDGGSGCVLPATGIPLGGHRGASPRRAPPAELPGPAPSASADGLRADRRLFRRRAVHLCRRLAGHPDRGLPCASKPVRPVLRRQRHRPDRSDPDQRPPGPAHPVRGDPQLGQPGSVRRRPVARGRRRDRVRRPVGGDGPNVHDHGGVRLQSVERHRRGAWGRPLEDRSHLVAVRRRLVRRRGGRGGAGGGFSRRDAPPDGLCDRLRPAVRCRDTEDPGRRCGLADPHRLRRLGRRP